MKRLNLNYSEGRAGKKKNLTFDRTFSGGLVKTGAKGTKLSWEESGLVGFFLYIIFVCAFYIFRLFFPLYI